MSFLSLFLTTGTILIVFINSMGVILNNINKDGGSKNIPNILGYATALMFILSLMFVFPMGVGSADGKMFYHLLVIFMLVLPFVILQLMNPKNLNEGAILVAFSTLGLILMVETTHFIGFYLGVELYSLSAYILASGAGTLNTLPLKGKSESYVLAPSVSAGLKYFLLSALSSGVLVGGISIIYACTGELSIEGVSRMVTMLTLGNIDNRLLFTVVGICLVLTTLAFKLGSAPFHFWVPDVYSKVSIFVNFYLISVPKIGILLALIKITQYLPVAEDLIAILAGASLIIGAIGGLVQQKLTRLLAYSSISHVGYLLLALYASSKTSYTAYLTPSANVAHLYNIGLYIIIYSVMTLAFFSVLNILRKCYANDNEPYIFISSLKNLSRKAPYLAGSLAVTVLSMGGVPPLAGFIAKFSVYMSVLDSNGIYLGIFAVLCSVVTAVYYLRIIKVSYFYNTDLVSDYKSKDVSNFSAMVVAISTLYLIAYPFLSPHLLYLLLVL